MQFQFFPKFMICDAIDGAGKGAIPEVVKEWAQERGLRFFDAGKHAVDHHEIPSWDEVKKQNPDVLFVAEPTHEGVGRTIRLRLNKSKAFDPLTIAHAFAIDRFVLYEALVGLALRDGVYVVSDRAVTTSLVYQPIDAERRGGDRRAFAQVVEELPGNKYAMGFVPGMIMLLHADVDVAQARLESREKKDDSHFEEKEFQRKVAAAYWDKEFRDIYEKRGTKFADLVQAKDETRKETKQKAKQLWELYVASIEDKN